MADKPYDLAIVGAGMAGCILAARIAEKGVNPKTGEPLRVALLEQGPYFKGDSGPGYGAPMRRQMFTNVSSDFEGRYMTRYGLPPGGGRRVPLRPDQEVFVSRTAAVVGGGSMLYTAITHVPYELDYEVWVKETGTDWTYQNFKPAADEINRMFNIHAKPPELLCRLDHLFRDAARAMGYRPDDATIARKNCLYCGYCDGTNLCKYDARMGGFVSYMPIALKHGVEVIPDAPVEKILIEKAGARPQVKGVAFTQHGSRRTLEVSKVILSAGTFGNPPVLYRSGCGPRELVEGEPIVENRNVGYHTDCRPSIDPLVGVFDEPVSSAEFHDGNVAGAYWVYHDTTPDRRYDRVEITIRGNELPAPDRVAVNAAAPDFGRTHREYMRDVVKINAMTRAQREILSQGFADIRLVRPRTVRGWITEWGEHVYQGNDPSILKPLEEGRRIAREMFKKMGAREVRGLDRPARVRGLPTWVGSCRPGVDPKESVINSHFESHDIDGLFVCDASAVPRGASQGYAGTVAVVAVFGASRIVDRHFKRG